MSLLARIFIVLNAVLAILFLGTTATLYAYRTDWRAATLHVMSEFNYMVQRKDESITSLKSDVQTMSGVVAAHQAENQSLRGVIGNIGDNLSSSREELARWKHEFEVLNQTHKIVVDRIKDKDEEINRLREDLDSKKQELDIANRDKETAEDQVARLTRRSAELEGNLREVTVQFEENRRKLADKELVLAELTNLGIPWEKLVTGAPPIPTINGVVMGVKTDIKPNLVLLSVGKNENVEVGFHFHIFRGNQFIGQVVVEKVLPNNAACRVVFTKDKAQIREGDNAATRL